MTHLKRGIGLSVLAVLLAAGAGKRFGGDGEKLFYEVGGTPMIVTALSLMLTTRVPSLRALVTRNSRTRLRD